MDNGRLMTAIFRMLISMDKSVRGSLPQEIRDCVLEHAMIAAGSALIPIPGACAAANVANIWTMYGRINSKVGITLSENILKTIASGVAANLGTYVLMLGVGEVLKFIPVVGTALGAAIDASIGYAVTLTSALIYINVITAFAGSGKKLNEENLAEKVDAYMKENAVDIKDFMREAKKSYKNDNNRR